MFSFLLRNNCTQFRYLSMLCFPIGYIKSFTSNSVLSFQLFHTDEKLFVFVLRTSDLELVSSRRLDSGTDIQSVKPASSNLHSDLRVVVLPPLEENNKGRKTQKKRDKSKNLFMKSVYNTILSAIIKHPDKETVREIGYYENVHNTAPLS